MSIRDDFFANKAVGALWDVAVSIKRGNPLPLDSNSVFESYSALETYAAGVLAYPGQIVAVVNEDSTGIYYLDQNLEINEVGKIPTADDKSIEVADGVISMYNFGKYFYKYIPEVKNEETGEVTAAAHYEKTEVSDTNTWAAGLEPKVVSENGELVIGWFEPNPTTVDGVQDQITAVQGTVSDLDEQLNKEGGLVDQVEDLQEEIGHAATEAGDAATGLYAELDKKANTADVYTKTETDELIANVDHLKRKIFDTLGEVQEFITQNPETADQYIYMIPTGLQEDSNRYYEYMLIDDILEPVGQWEVDMADYFTEDELKTYLESYYTSEQVDNILTTYAKSSDFEGYYTSEQVDAFLDKYYTQDELDDFLAQYVLIESGKSLVSDTEIAKLATVKENAEPNYIKSVTDAFSVSDEGQLSLNPLEISDINSLQNELDRKVDQIYYTITDEESGETIQVAGELITPTDREKLDTLIIGDDGIEISGKVNAANVEGLSEWITNNRNTITGLFPSADEEKISLQSTKIINLEDTLNGYTDEEGNQVTGLVSVVNNFANTYVALSDFNSVVGDLNQMKAQDVNLWSDVQAIQEALRWQNMSE